MVDIGLVHGRFQGLHHGHMEYILSAKKLCKHLLVGICNPDPTQTIYDAANPTRSEHDANPFSYYERFCMLRNALLEAGVTKMEFDILPFPINLPALILNYAPISATYYLTIYDKWGEKKLSILQEIGLKVQVLWRRSMNERFTSGSEVRRCIMDNVPWNHLVPEVVYTYITRNGLDVRIREHAEKAVPEPSPRGCA